MGYQTNIVVSGADYFRAIKGNQTELYEDVRDELAAAIHQ